MLNTATPRNAVDMLSSVQIISRSQLHLLKTPAIFIVFDTWLSWLGATWKIGFDRLLIAWFGFGFVIIAFFLCFLLVHICLRLHVFCPDLLLLRLALWFWC